MAGLASVKLARVVLVRGLPQSGGVVHAPKGVAVFNHLGAREMGRVICQSRLVLARSGYSTVMDLVQLGKKAIYIPTPGQPEQEYLGGYLQERGLGICMKQRGFVLKKALDRAGPLLHLAGMSGDPEPVSGNGRLAQETARVLATARAQSGAGSIRGGSRLNPR